LIIPISAMFAGIQDFLIAFIVLIGTMAYFGMALTAAVWTLPPAVSTRWPAPWKGFAVRPPLRPLLLPPNGTDLRGYGMNDE